MFNGTDSVQLTTRYRHFPETYESGWWSQVMATLRPGDTVVDAGANVGIYAIAMAKRVRPGVVHAFEPDPRAARGLREHVRLNRVEDAVVVEERAVGDIDGVVTMTLRTSDTNSSIAALPLPPGIQDRSAIEEIDVPAVRLDTQFAGVRVDVLKVDVEGFEGAVLDGAETLLRDPVRRPRTIFLEVHPWALPRPPEALADLLVSAGYDVDKLDPGGASNYYWIATAR